MARPGLAALVLALLPAQTGLSTLPFLAAPAEAQVRFEAAVADLRHPDSGTRLRAVQILKPAAYPESAIPLAAVVVDPLDNIQLEAMAAALNIFLAEPIVPSSRRGLIVEVRKRIAAEEIFATGPLALNTVPIPPELLSAFLRACRDENPRVAAEALYAFGALAAEAVGAVRQDLLRASGPQLAGMVGTQDPTLRVAAVRVIGRLFAKRPGDGQVDEPVGDGVILALNDRISVVRLSAMDALGSMRYERAVQALTTLFEFHRKNELGTGALAALSRIGHPASAAMFREQMTKGNATGKILAIEGLARVGDAAVAESIRAALARERNDVVLLAERFASVILSNGILDPLFEALGKSSLRETAMRYLVEVAPGRSAAFARAAQDPEARLRADVADILGIALDTSALAVILPLKQDKAPLVARAAERAEIRLSRLQ